LFVLKFNIAMQLRRNNMSGLVFACIAPHATMVIPVLAGKQGHKALATRAAMEELSRRMQAAHPETVVVITPHGHRIDETFSLLNNRRVRGELEPDEKDGNQNGLSLVFDVDKEMNAAIVDTARSLEVPVSRLGYAVLDDPTYYQPLDWGAAVPLYFMGAMLQPRPRVVIACPDRSNMPWELFPTFGKAIRLAAQATGRRVGLIASADMGHAHDIHGPYGFNPASREFDAATIEAIEDQDPGRLLKFDLGWVQHAATDAFGQILNLAGAVEGTGFRGELLSYEVPTYFGMMCVAYSKP
jgi:aromatic ring-opening dioxygenase LigB subunit